MVTAGQLQKEHHQAVDAHGFTDAWEMNQAVLRVQPRLR
jgi:hypothetical protein